MVPVLRRLFRWSAIALILAAFYVLSAGPAVWIVRKTGIGETPFGVIYGPLEWFATKTTIGKGIDDYVQFFIDDADDVRGNFDMR